MLAKAIAETPFPSSGETARVRDIVREMDRIAIGAVLFVCAALNVIPAPPGLSLFFGAPMLLVAVLQGLRKPLWLPAVIMERQITRLTFDRYKSTLQAWLDRAGKWLTHGYTWHQDALRSRIIDWFIVALALGVMIPLPFTAMLPAAAACLITFGRLEGDGRLVGVGIASGVVALGITSVMVFGTIRLISLIF